MKTDKKYFNRKEMWHTLTPGKYSSITASVHKCHTLLGSPLATEGWLL